MCFASKSIKNSVEYFNLLLEKNSDLVRSIKQTVHSPFDSLDSLECFKLDIGADSNQQELISCTICNKNVEQSKLREHVGAHIMQGDLINNANTCGYCGGENCSIQLKITSGFGAKATYGPYSNCDNFVKFSLACAKKSKP